MPQSYIVTLKENVAPEELQKTKDQVKEQGGKITNEFSLIKGFSVEYPDGHASVLSSNDKVEVEKDQEMKTQ